VLHGRFPGIVGTAAYANCAVAEPGAEYFVAASERTPLKCETGVDFPRRLAYEACVWKTPEPP
jgi:hypothetical protein